MVFAGVPLASTPFADGPAISGAVTVVGDGAVTIELVVSGTGAHQAEPVVGYAEIVIEVSGTGYTEVYGGGAVQLDLTVTGAAVRGVTGFDGAGNFTLDVYGRSLAVFAQGSLIVQPSVVGVSIGLVNADSAIQYELEVVGTGSVATVVSGSGVSEIALTVTGTGTHGVSSAGDVVISAEVSGQINHGISSVIGEVAYSLDVRGRGRHLSAEAVGLINSFGDFTVRPAVTGSGAVGVSGSGAIAFQLDAYGDDIIPVGRGATTIRISAAGYGEHHPISALCGRVTILPEVVGLGSTYDSFSYVIGGNRNPIYLTISGSGYHA